MPCMLWHAEFAIFSWQVTNVIKLQMEAASLKAAACFPLPPIPETIDRSFWERSQYMDSTVGVIIDIIGTLPIGSSAGNFQSQAQNIKAARPPPARG